MAHHKDLTGVDLHEPKGAASAAAGTVYVADGLGSGSWLPRLPNNVILNARIDDVSTAGDIYIPVPIAGVITRISTTLGAAISVADANITFSINGVAIDGSAITIAFTGSAPGDVDSSTPSGHNTVAVGNQIKVSTDGGSTTTAPLTVSILIDAS